MNIHRIIWHLTCAWFTVNHREAFENLYHHVFFQTLLRWWLWTQFDVYRFIRPPLHCTAVKKAMRQHFTTMKSFCSNNYFDFFWLFFAVTSREKTIQWAAGRGWWGCVVSCEMKYSLGNLLAFNLTVGDSLTVWQLRNRITPQSLPQLNLQEHWACFESVKHSWKMDRLLWIWTWVHSHSSEEEPFSLLTLDELSTHSICLSSYSSFSLVSPKCVSNVVAVKWDVGTLNNMFLFTVFEGCLRKYSPTASSEIMSHNRQTSPWVNQAPHKNSLVRFISYPRISPLNTLIQSVHHQTSGPSFHVLKKPNQTIDECLTEWVSGGTDFVRILVHYLDVSPLFAQKALQCWMCCMSSKKVC